MALKQVCQMHKVLQLLQFTVTHGCPACPVAAGRSICRQKSSARPWSSTWRSPFAKKRCDRIPNVDTMCLAVFDECGCTNSNILIWLYCGYADTWRHCFQKACRFLLRYAPDVFAFTKLHSGHMGHFLACQI